MDQLREAGIGDGDAARIGRRAPELTPLFELDPSGGQVIITRFECPSLVSLAYLAILHWRVKRDVRRVARGLIAARAVLDWRRRTMLSVTLWTDLDSVYAMGDVSRHIAAARVPARLGVRTRCGVFCYAGDWRRVMFHGQAPKGTPLKGEKSVASQD